MKLQTKVACIVGLVVIVLGALQWERHTRIAPVTFEPTGWAAGDESARFPMAADLIRTRRLVGRTQSEIEKMLGNPTEKSAVGHWYYQLKGRWLYSELEIEWTPRKTVASARIDT